MSVLTHNHPATYRVQVTNNDSYFETNNSFMLIDFLNNDPVVISWLNSVVTDKTTATLYIHDRLTITRTCN